MSKLPLQRGTSQTADFEENTWTFEMPEKFRVTAGRFVIIPEEKFEAFARSVHSARELIKDFSAQKIIQNIECLLVDIEFGE